MSIFDNPFMIILLLLVFFGVIALVVFLIRKHVGIFKDDDSHPVSEEEAAKEALDRILVDVPEEQENVVTEQEETNVAEDVEEIVKDEEETK